MIVVEKGVPVPKKREVKKRESRYPFDVMDVGDSFLIATDCTKVRAAAYAYAKRQNKKFVVRKIGSAHRCWRLA